MKKSISYAIMVSFCLLGISYLQAGWYDVIHINTIENRTPYNITVTNKETSYPMTIAPQATATTDVNKMYVPWRMSGTLDKNFIFIEGAEQGTIKVCDAGVLLVAKLELLDSKNNVFKKITLDRGNTYNIVMSADPGQPVDVAFNLTKASTIQKLVTTVVNTAEKVVTKVANVASSVVQTVALPIKEQIKKDQIAIKNNPYKDTVAHVRLGGPIPPDEVTFRTARLPKVTVAQEKLLDITYEEGEEPLEITLVYSGGGWRAEALCAGAADGADKIGLWDATTYASGLSGSTWFLAPYFAGDPKNNNIPLTLDEYRKQLLPKLIEGLPIKEAKILPPDQIKAIGDALLVKFAFDQPVGSIDFYGAIIANNLLQQFGDDRQRVHISDQAVHMKTGNWPMPICTAVLGMRGYDMLWSEVTPFETGSRKLGNTQGMFVPTWAFGRKFANGASTDFAPEQNMGYFMGMFGSAYGASFQDIYEQIIKNMNIPTAIKDVFLGFVRTEIGQVRTFWAEAYNFTYGMPESVITKEEKIKEVDAGLDFMNPVFSTYRKTVNPTSQELLNNGTPDIIFIFDEGAKVGSQELYLQAEHAEREGFDYPIKTKAFKQIADGSYVFIDDNLQKSVSERAITVFMDENNLSIPVVFYMPRVTDPMLAEKYKEYDPENKYALATFDINKAVAIGHAGTFNLKYTQAQAEQLLMLGEANIRGCEQQIKDTIRKRLELKYPNKKPPVIQTSITLPELPSTLSDGNVVQFISQNPESLGWLLALAIEGKVWLGLVASTDPRAIDANTNFTVTNVNTDNNTFQLMTADGQNYVKANSALGSAWTLGLTPDKTDSSTFFGFQDSCLVALNANAQGAFAFLRSTPNLPSVLRFHAVKSINKQWYPLQTPLLPQGALTINLIQSAEEPVVEPVEQKKAALPAPKIIHPKEATTPTEQKVSYKKQPRKALKKEALKKEDPKKSI